jgi:TonB-linked SusC/RagA family outer membrane protein
MLRHGLFVSSALALAVGLVGPPALRAQGTGTVTGTVRSTSTAQGLPSAQVSLVGTQLSTQTDANGHYTLGGVPAGAQQLQARLIGYGTEAASVQVSAGQTVTVNLDLQEKAIELSQIIVTGTPGATEKKAVGNVVATVAVPQLMANAPLNSISQVLNGRVAGVTVLSSTGEVGGAAKVRVRGPATFSLSNTPLIYVDGVRVDNDEATGPTNQSFGSRSISRLSDINPEDILSIEVIKGPAAATLYGTEAANGVIQIITKKGRQGGTRFDLQVNEGANWFANPAGRLWTNYGMVGGVLDSINFTQLQNNWLGMQRAMGETPKNIFQTGMLQTYNASMSGGNELAQFFVSGYYQHDVGVESVNKLRKGGGRLNMSVTPSAHWRVDGNFGYIVGRTDLACEAGCGGVTWTTYFMDPTTLSDSMRQGFFSGTPDSYHTLYPEWQDVGRFTGSIQIHNDPVPWFSHRLTVGLDQTLEQDHDLEVRNDQYTYYDSFASTGYADVVDTRVNYTTADYSGTLHFNLGSSFTSQTSFGGQYYRKHNDFVEAYGEGFPAPGLTSVNATTQNRATSQTYVNNTTVGFYGQEQFGWHNNRFVTVGLRVDDNSAFGSNFSAVVYPKVSGTWTLSDESFWHVPAVNTLRLRLAYGQSGHQPDAFAALRTFSPITGPNDVGTVTPGTPGNPNLGPERSSEIEAGFDAGLLNDRLGIEFTYFTEQTRDAILEQQIAPSTGFYGLYTGSPGLQYVNAGRVDNNGVEVVLRGTPVASDKVTWDFSFNVSTDNNEVVSLGTNTTQDFVSAGTYVQHHIGYPVGSWFQKKLVSAELDAGGNAINVMCQTASGGTAPCSTPGDSMLVYLGRNTPKVDGGFSSTLTLFHNLRLFGQLDFKTGYSKLDGNQRVRCFFFGLCRENYVPQDYDPVLIAGYQDGYPAVLIHNASFAKLREISATYTLPGSWLGVIGAHNASVTLSGRNLITWTSYPGLEPEATFNGGSRGGDYSLWEQDVTPQLAQFVATFRVSF